MFRLLKLLIVSCALTLLAQSGSLAGQVNWGSDPLQTNNQTSAGNPLTADFIFELGVFRPGFTPTSSNTDEWAANWTAADRVLYNPSTRFFAGSYVIETNESPFLTTAQGYIWGYNQDQPAGEWILATNTSWLWPSEGGLSFPVTWSMSMATTLVVGQVNTSGSPFYIQMEAVTPADYPCVTGDRWRSQHFTGSDLLNPNVSGLEADPDGDGVTNVVEMGLGTNPKVADRDSLPSVEVVSFGGSEFLQLSFSKITDRKLDYRIEVSEDGTNWSSGSAEVTEVANTLRQIVGRDNTPMAPGVVRFIRLRMAIP